MILGEKWIMGRCNLRPFISFMSAVLISILFVGCPIVPPNYVEPPGPPDPEPEPESGIVAEPAFNPPEGIYTSAQAVQITCSTASVEIRYTVDGNQPSDASTLYTGVLDISSTTTLRAIAIKSGLMSSFGSADYTITGKVEKPVVLPSSGSFAAPVEVTITCGTAGADIHYTVNEGNPQSTSPIYGGPFTISGTSTVRAVAMKSGWTNSDMSFSDIVINIPSDTAAPPEISPDGGLYYEDQAVSLIQPDAEEIYYTTDGSDPTVSGTRVLYEDVIAVDITGTQIRAYAIDSGKVDQDSAVVSATYRLKAATPVPTPSPAAGAVDYGIVVNLSSTTPGVSIYFSNTGEDPTTLFPALGINLYSPRLKAIAVKTGYEDSDLLVAEYKVKSLFAYTDGNNHIYRLTYNGDDIDITSMFENATGTTTFSAIDDGGTYTTIYSSEGKIYQLVKDGLDIDITSGFESFADGSTLFELDGSMAYAVYKTSDKLYAYDPVGVDADITPPYFSTTSEVLYLIYTDGTGKAYSYALEDPVDGTAFFENFTSSSHLVWVDTAQANYPPLGYSTGASRWILDPAVDVAFDSSEYEYFTIESIVLIAREL